MKLTEWYPGDVKPVRVGVYQRPLPFNPNHAYSLWDGKFWRRYHFNMSAAAKQKPPSDYQSMKWRGVAK